MYEVILRNNETGEERRRVFELDWVKDGDNGDASYFWWTQGNFGCDCNRRDEWLRAGGVEPGPEEVTCTTGKFGARVVLDGVETSLDGD